MKSELMRLNQQFQQQIDKNDQLEKKYIQITKQLSTVQQQKQQLEGKVNFLNKQLIVYKQSSQQYDAQIQQLKAQVAKYETRISIICKDTGIQPYLMKQLNLEQEIASLQEQLQNKNQQIEKLQQELVISSNALSLKEEQFLPANTALSIAQTMNKQKVTSEIIRKSLFRTIATLKQECDLYEKLFKEEQVKRSQIQQQLSSVKDEIIQNQLDVQLKTEQIDALILENTKIQDLQQQIMKSEAQIANIRQENKSINQLNQELMQQIQDIQSFELIKQNNEQLRKELLKREQAIQNLQKQQLDAHQQSQNKLMLIEESFNEKLNSQQKLIEQLKEDNANLQIEKEKLQKAIVLTAKMKAKEQSQIGTFQYLYNAQNDTQQPIQQYQ